MASEPLIPLFSKTQSLGLTVILKVVSFDSLSTALPNSLMSVLRNMTISSRLDCLQICILLSMVRKFSSSLSVFPSQFLDPAASCVQGRLKWQGCRRDLWRSLSVIFRSCVCQMALDNVDTVNPGNISTEIIAKVRMLRSGNSEQ